jgi:hypothetical protein
MDATRFDRIQQLFELCRALPPEDRAARLRLDAAGDAEIEQEVRTLLAAYDRAGDFLEEPALEAGAGIVELAVRSEFALAPGRRIGHYKVLSTAGAGRRTARSIARWTRVSGAKSRFASCRRG